MDLHAKALTTALGLGLLAGCGNGEIGDPTGGTAGASTTASSGTVGGAGGAGGALSTGGAGGATGTGGVVDPGKPIFVIGGQDQRHLRSFDGMTWEDDVYVAPQGNKDNAFYTLAVGAGVVIAAGDSGLWTSPDGKAWAQVSGQSSSLHASVAIYADRFVIVHSDAALTSTDGVVWEKASSTGTAGHWSSITHGAGRYLAVGDGGCRKVSEDGLAWHDYLCEDNGFTSFAYGNGVFVGLNAKGRHAVSLDGITWEHDVTETDATLQGWQSVAFGAGHFVTAHGKSAFTTDDGVTWTKQGHGGPSQLVYAGGRFVGFSWRTKIYVSDDGTDFQQVWSADAVADQFDATRMSPWFTGIGAGLLP